MKRTLLGRQMMVLPLSLLCLLLSSCSTEYEQMPVPPTLGCDSTLVRQLLDTGLPVVWIKTIGDEEPVYEIADAPTGCWGGSITNATKVPGRVVVQDKTGVVYESGEYVEDQQGMAVKVRGNWSARRPKKPFKIKLQRKADMLGRGDSRFADKDWLLMPFFSLNSLIGLKVNELMGLGWTPQYKFVNVVFNGEFRGLYMLMESIDRNADCRINVAKTGCVMELDAYWWNEDMFVFASFDEPLNYTFKYPESKCMSGECLDYLQKVVSEAEESTRTGSYQEKIDVDSFARWMLAHDILGNSDGAGSNMFLTKYDNTDGSRLMMGPLWDFDVIMKSEGWDEIHGRYFFKGLFDSEDRTFVDRYVVLWEDMKDRVFDGLKRYLDSYLASDLCRAVDTSILLNNERWAGEMYSLPLSAGFVEDAKSYLHHRKDWMDVAVKGLSQTNPR